MPLRLTGSLLGSSVELGCPRGFDASRFFETLSGLRDLRLRVALRPVSIRFLGYRPLGQSHQDCRLLSDPSRLDRTPLGAL